MQISEIAKKSGVSSMVVSRVMQGSPSVKRPDRERVERAVAELKLNAMRIVSEKQKLNRVFGVIIPRFEDIFHSFYATEIIKGVVLAASRLKIDIMVHVSERHVHEDWLTSTALSPGYIDGVIFADINGDRQQLKKVIARKIPCIVLNNHLAGEPISTISVDNQKAAYNVCEYLIGLGHKKIATICGDLSTDAGQKRLEGFKDCLRNHNIRQHPKYIAVGYFLRSPARIAMENLLKMDDRPTAVFCASDVMAMEAIDVAKKHSLRVPEDISIIGFDDNPLAVYSPVPLTTVWQPITEMGRMGVEFLNQMIVGKKKSPFKVLLQTRLVERRSCANSG